MGIRKNNGKQSLKPGESDYITLTYIGKFKDIWYRFCTFIYTLGQDFFYFLSQEVTPKSGLSIEVSGTGSVDLSKPKDPALSLTAAVDAEVCIIGICFSISETILKLPKK